MSFNRNFRSDYWGTQNTSSSGASLYSNVRHSTSFSNYGTRNPVSQSRQDYVSPTAQDCGPPTRKDYVPLLRHDYGLGSRRDYVPAVSRYNEPPTRKDCISPNRIDYGSYLPDYSLRDELDMGSQIKQNFGNPSRSGSGPYNIRQYGSQLGQDPGLQSYGPQNNRAFSPQNRKDYYPQREGYNQRNQDYGPQDKRDYGSPRRPDYDSQYSHDYGRQSRQEYRYRQQDYRKDNKPQQNSRHRRKSRRNSIPPQEENFCKYCKILCNGQKAYKVHCTTDRHKKQEQLAIERLTVPRDPVRSADLLCPLCEVFCPDSFSYKGHLRGSKHKQVLMLYKKMNKPIPQFRMHAVKAEAAKRALPVGEEFVVKCAPLSDGAQDEEMVFCKLCSRKISEPNKISHCKGREHRSNYVLKLKEERQKEAVENRDPQNDYRPFAEDVSLFWEKEENCKIRNAESYQVSQDNDAGNSEVEETSQKNKNQIRCELCNLSCPDQYNYSLHIRGSQHRREVTYLRRFKGIRVSRNQMKAEKAEAIANIPLIGEEYIVIRDDSESDGKSPADPNILFCKLCKCQLNLKSKDRHLKGRRHRLAYKEKVDPNLPELIREKNVPWKLFLKQKREERNRNMTENSATNQGVEQSSENRKENIEDSENIDDEENNAVKPPTYSDLHITLKEEAIYPEESILQDIEQSVSDCEEALRCVRSKISDCTAEGGKKNNDSDNSVKTSVLQKDDQSSENVSNVENSSVNTSELQKDNESSESVSNVENNSDKTSELQKDNQSSENVSNLEEGKDSKDDDVNCAIKAVIRIGCFAKDIMLKGENISFLVVLCEELPTVLFLNNFYKLFCQELKINSGEDKYTTNLVTKDATIVVASKSDSNIVINITFTSTKLTQEIRTQKENLLNQDIDYGDKPLDALVQLRRARWFKVKLEDHHNCIVLLRVLRAMCKENPTWSSLSCWVLELMLERVFFKAEDQSLGGIMRTFLEALSAGIILPDSPGIIDPCEKDPTDATNYLTLQQKVDITTTAQFILRRMAFNFINKVLNTVIPYEELQFIPSVEDTPSVATKRRHEDVNEIEGNDSKKGKTSTAE